MFLTPGNQNEHQTFSLRFIIFFQSKPFSLEESFSDFTADL